MRNIKYLILIVIPFVLASCCSDSWLWSLYPGEPFPDSTPKIRNQYGFHIIAKNTVETNYHIEVDFGGEEPERFRIYDRDPYGGVLSTAIIRSIYDITYVKQGEKNDFVEKYSTRNPLPDYINKHIKAIRLYNWDNELKREWVPYEKDIPHSPFDINNWEYELVIKGDTIVHQCYYFTILPSDYYGEE